MKQKSRVFSVFLALTFAALVPIEDIYTGGGSRSSTSTVVQTWSSFRSHNG